MKQKEKIKVEKEKAEDTQKDNNTEDVSAEELKKESKAEESPKESNEESQSDEKESTEKTDKRDQKIQELNEKLMRTMAEFDNFRKRSEKEKSTMFEIGAKDIIEKILPVIDNFERGLDSITEEEKSSAFAQGIEQIYKQLLNVLEEAGVKAIEAVGKEFDPNLHNAVMHAEDDSLGENVVSDEFQKGYMYRDTVVRHSMVKVVN